MRWRRKKYTEKYSENFVPEKADCLQIDGLSVDIRYQGQDCPALEDVSFTVHSGEIVGLVGESGCGKSLTSLAVIGLLPKAARIQSGKILLGDKDLVSMKEQEKCLYRGSRIAMIFQDPMSALNPLMTIGKQIEESYTIHHSNKTAEEAKEKTLEMMRKAGLSRVEELYKEYPHQLSGGMKQRAMIAMALINHPDVIIADEPTTALDVTIQAQILELLQELNKEFNSMILLISHDLGVIRSVCDRTLVMYGGRIVEEGKTEDILRNPEHPYTKGLLASVPVPENKGQDITCIPGFVEPLEKRKSTGCPFAGRCNLVQKQCTVQCPELIGTSGHYVRCLLTGGVQDVGE